MNPLRQIRQRIGRVGTDQAALELLRRALASSENRKMLRALATVVEEVRDYISADSLGALADFRDRLTEKSDRLGFPVPPSRRQPSSDDSDDFREAHVYRAAAMIQDAKFLSALKSAHGDAARSDIAPELLAALAARDCRS
jgi:hypothetical protein